MAARRNGRTGQTPNSRPAMGTLLILEEYRLADFRPSAMSKTRTRTGERNVGGAASLEQLEQRTLLNGELPFPSVFDNGKLVSSVLTADFDIDGLPDLVVSAGRQIAFLRNVGDGSFEPARVLTTVMASSTMATSARSACPLHSARIRFRPRIVRCRQHGREVRSIFLRATSADGTRMSGVVSGDRALTIFKHAPNTSCLNRM